MLNAPVRYFGGKGTTLKKLLSHFPKDTKYTTYVEPYGGSGVVLLNKPKKDVEVYNDIYELIYTLYMVLHNKELFEEFTRRVSLLPYHEQLRSDFKGKLKTNTFTDDVDKALAYYYVNRTSVNGIGGFSSNYVVRRKLPKAVSDYLSSVDGLEDLHQRLSNVIITKQDAISLISKWDKALTFIYCDPPYVSATRGDYRYEHEEDHSKLLETLLNIKKATVCVSGYSHSSYDVLLEHGWVRHEFKVNRLSGTRVAKSATECVWCNYNETANSR